MKLLKRDFVPKDTKSICDRPLISGKAYYIDDNGTIKYASESYVRSNFSKEERDNIIDFTKGLIASFENISSDNEKANLNGGGKKIDKYHKAVLYICLYEEKMNNFDLAKKKPFIQKMYEIYKEKGGLSDNQVDVILEIEKQERQYRKSLKNLLTCYAYEYKIKRALEVLPEDKKEFMKDILADLYKYKNLTTKQIEGMKNWFEYLTDDLKNTKLKEFDIVKKAENEGK